MPVKAILIDISDTLIKDGEVYPDADKMISQIQGLDIEVFLVSNNVHGDIFGIGNDRVLYPKMVNGQKGSGSFVKYVAKKTGIPENEILYLGDVEQDMWEAHNGNVLFLRADWSTHHKKTSYGIILSSPEKAVKFIKDFFLKDKLWYYMLDDFDDFGSPVHYRSLLNPETATKKGVKDLFKRKTKNSRLQAYLTLHLIASSSLEGLFLPDQNGKRPIICLYPSHNGQQTGALEFLANLSKKLFDSDFKPDLILRHKTAIKSAYARTRGETVTLENQLSTIQLNPKHKDKIVGRKILIFDDFTTEGLGLETARNFLLNAGAGEVFCITAGKYGFETEIFTPNFGVSWDSFEPTDLTDKEFTKTIKHGNFDSDVASAF